MADVFTVLGQDHARVKAMVADLEGLIGPQSQPTPRLVQEGGRLADLLVTDESRHEAVEEMYFWPAVKEKVANGEQFARTALEQESEAKKVLAALDGTPPDDAAFIPLVTRFAEMGAAHIAYEEQEVWPALRAVLTAAEAASLGERIEAAKAAAPTRPHPHTPPDPGVLKTAGAAAAVTDKIRDAVSGRQS